MTEETLEGEWHDIALGDGPQLVGPTEYEIIIHQDDQPSKHSIIESPNFNDQKNRANKMRVDVPPADFLEDETYLGADAEVYLGEDLLFGGRIVDVAFSHERNQPYTLNIHSPAFELEDESITLNVDTETTYDVIAKVIDEYNEYDARLKDLTETEQEVLTDVDIVASELLESTANGATAVYEDVGEDGSDTEILYVKLLLPEDDDSITVTVETEEESHSNTFDGETVSSQGDWFRLEPEGLDADNYDIEFEMDEGTQLHDWIILTERRLTRDVAPITDTGGMTEIRAQLADDDDSLNDLLAPYIDDTDPVRIQDNKVEFLQTSWLILSEEGTDQASAGVFGGLGAGEIFGDLDAPDGSDEKWTYGSRLDDVGRYLEVDFSTDYVIPEESLEVRLRWITVDENGEEVDNLYGGFGDTRVSHQLNGQEFQEINMWGHPWDPLPWGPSRTVSDEVQPGNHTYRVEVTEESSYSDEEHQHRIAEVAIYDNRFSYTFDEEPTEIDGFNYLDGPELYPDEISVEFDEYISDQQIVNANVFTDLEHTDNTNIQVSFDQGENWLPDDPEDSNTVYAESVDLTTTVRGRWNVGAGSPDGAIENNPRLGYAGNSLDTWDLRINSSTGEVTGSPRIELADDESSLNDVFGGSAAEHDAVEITEDGVGFLQSGYWELPEFGAQQRGGTEYIGDTGSNDSATAGALGGSNGEVGDELMPRLNADLDYTIPEENATLALRCKHEDAEVGGAPHEIFVDGVSMGSWAAGFTSPQITETMGWYIIDFDHMWENIGDIGPGEVEVEIVQTEDTNDSNMQTIVDAVFLYDDRFSYNFDNEVTHDPDASMNYIDGPEMYPTDVEIESIDHDRGEQILSSIIYTEVAHEDDTALQLSFDSGETWVPEEAVEDVVISMESDILTTTVRGRWIAGASSPDGERADNPAFGYDSNTLELWDVRANASSGQFAMGDDFEQFLPPIEDDVPLEITEEGVELLQHNFVWDAQDLGGWQSGAIEEDDDYTGGEAPYLLSEVGTVAASFDLEYTIPQEYILFGIRHDGRDREDHIPFRVVLDGQEIFSAGQGALIADLRWFDQIGAPDFDLEPGNHEFYVEGTDGDGDDFVIDALCIGDLRYMETSFDNEVHEPAGYLDNPKQYPDIDVDIDEFISDEQIPRALAIIDPEHIENTSLQLSFDSGETWNPDDGSENEILDLELDAPELTTTAQGRVGMGSTSPDGAQDETPRFDYSGNTLQRWELLTSDVGTIDTIFNREFKGNRLSIITQIAEDHDPTLRWEGREANIFQRGQFFVSPNLRKAEVREKNSVEGAYRSCEVVGKLGVTSGVVEADTHPSVTKHKLIEDPTIDSADDAISRAQSFLDDHSGVRYEATITTPPTLAPVGYMISGDNFRHEKDLQIESVRYTDRNATIQCGRTRDLTRQIEEIVTGRKKADSDATRDHVRVPVRDD